MASKTFIILITLDRTQFKFKVDLSGGGRQYLPVWWPRYSLSPPSGSQDVGVENIFYSSSGKCERLTSSIFARDWKSLVRVSGKGRGKHDIYRPPPETGPIPKEYRSHQVIALLGPLGMQKRISYRGSIYLGLDLGRRIRNCSVCGRGSFAKI